MIFPKICVISQTSLLDMARYRYFLGSSRKKDGCSSIVDLIFSFIDLEPDGCLVADQLRIRTKTFEITGAGKEKGLIPLLDDVPAKKMYFFAMERYFLLTGAF